MDLLLKLFGAAFAHKLLMPSMRPGKRHLSRQHRHRAAGAKLIKRFDRHAHSKLPFLGTGRWSQ